MAAYTTNYGLHQWVPEDDFLRTDFNTDFQKIDAAIKGVETGTNTALALKADKTELTQACGALNEAKCEALTGSYTGNGASARIIDLGCTPKAVLINSFLGTPERPSNYLINILENGFQVHSSLGSSTNTSGTIYYYLALV